MVEFLQQHTAAVVLPELQSFIAPMGVVLAVNHTTGEIVDNQDG